MALKLIRRRRYAFSVSLILQVFILFTPCFAETTSCVKPKCNMLRSEEPVHEQVSSSPEEWKYYCFEGQTQTIFKLWCYPMIKVSFMNGTDTQSYSTYRKIYGDSVEDLDKKAGQNGPLTELFQYFNIMFNSDTDDIPLKAFNFSCIGIKTDKDYTTKFIIKQVHLWYVAYLALGTLIFLSAKSWSHNTALHYGTGMSLGVIASIIILIFIIHRAMPQSLRKVGYVMIISGVSLSGYLWTTFARLVIDPASNQLYEYWQWILGYVAVTGFISFTICYMYGPVTNPRSLNIIQWLIQAFALFLVYQGTQIRELSVALIVLLLTIYNIPRKMYKNRFTMYIKYRFLTPAPRLITEEEYLREATEETRKALDELKSFCRSPECDTWKYVSILKSPQRFASFVEGDSWHVTGEEQLEYASDPEMLPVSDHDLDEEDEIDFILSSP